MNAEQPYMVSVDGHGLHENASTFPGKGRLRSSANNGNETILLIEDKNSTRERLASALAGKGYSVFTAADGAEGVEHFRKFQEYVDLVIVDFGLPRLSGLEAARQIKNIKSGVKVILMIADPGSPISDEYRESGIDEVLVKPFTMKSAMEAIRKSLGTYVG
jgi:DNA-binding response OmpR family regulator